jgi:hypothetical protein
MVSMGWAKPKVTVLSRGTGLSGSRRIRLIVSGGDIVHAKVTGTKKAARKAASFMAEKSRGKET